MRFDELFEKKTMSEASLFPVRPLARVLAFFGDGNKLVNTTSGRNPRRKKQKK